MTEAAAVSSQFSEMAVRHFRCHPFLEMGHFWKTSNKTSAGGLAYCGVLTFTDVSR